jgi:uncharacterized protein YndB with AHSA1/START domain
MTNETQSTAPANEPILLLERVFDAPRDLVWQAWTDPEQLGKWFFPHAFKATRVELDVRPGGKSVVDMQGPDGTVYPNRGRYIDVDPPNKLSYTDDVDPAETAWGNNPPPSNVQTITFEDLDGKTKLSVHIQLTSVQDRDAMVEMGAVAGWSESFEKLDALLAA